MSTGSRSRPDGGEVVAPFLDPGHTATGHTAAGETATGETATGETATANTGTGKTGTRGASAEMSELDARRVAPDLVSFLTTLERKDLADLARVRAGTSCDAELFDHNLRIRTVAVPGPDGGPAVPVRLYDGRTPASGRPGIVHIHGGAFVSGDPSFEHRRSVALARGGRCLVASVDYRLAPEHRYPAGFDDCCAVLDWMHAEADALGIDRGRIGLAGSSAGGCLAAAVALRARDTGGSPVAFQILVYPALDCRAGSASVAAFASIPGFCGRNVAEMWSHYLGDAEPDPYAAPALAADLRGVAPAFVSVAEFDPLRDEAIAYALRLLDSGVPVELRVFPGTWHGFDLVAPESATARAFNGAEVAALARFVGDASARDLGPGDADGAHDVPGAMSGGTA